MEYIRTIIYIMKRTCWPAIYGHEKKSASKTDVVAWDDIMANAPTKLSPPGCFFRLKRAQNDAHGITNCNTEFGAHRWWDGGWAIISFCFKLFPSGCRIEEGSLVCYFPSLLFCCFICKRMNDGITKGYPFGTIYDNYPVLSF